jgi:L-malate glycosyltransferase
MAPSPLRVLVVGNFLSDERLTRFYCEDLAPKLSLAGCEVLTTSTVSGRVGRLLDMVRTAVARRNSYDVATVDVYSGGGFLLAAVLLVVLRALEKPTVAVLHGGGLQEYSRRHGSRVRHLLAVAGRVVTPSMYLRDHFRTVRSDIVYLPNAMEIGAYAYRLRSNVEPRLCWLRAFDEAYDPVLAIRTLAVVRRRHPGAKLTMFGPVKRTELLEQVRLEIANLALQDCVQIPGAVAKDQVPSVLAAHHIFLNTTRVESFGVAVMEAAASGLPIVTTQVGEIPYLWKHRSDALLVPAGDADAMGRAVIELLDNPALAESLSRNARAKAEAYDWSQVLPLWLSVLQDVAAAPRPPESGSIKT